MTIDAESIPVVGRAYDLGVNPITTTLVLLGPVVLAILALLGRNPATVSLGIAYVLSLPASVAYFWATTSEGEAPGDDETDEDGSEETADADTGDDDTADESDDRDG